MSDNKTEKVIKSKLMKKVMENYWKRQEINRLESRINICNTLCWSSLAVGAISFIAMITSPIYLIPEKMPKGYTVYQDAKNTLESLELKKRNLNEPKNKDGLFISYENPKMIESLNRLYKVENEKKLEKISYINDAIDSLEKDMRGIRDLKIVEYEKRKALKDYKFIRNVLGGILGLGFGLSGLAFSLSRWSKYYNRLERLKEVKVKN